MSTHEHTHTHTENFYDSLTNKIMRNKEIWYSAASHALPAGHTPGQAGISNRITDNWQQPFSDIATKHSLKFKPEIVTVFKVIGFIWIFLSKKGKKGVGKNM